MSLYAPGVGPGIYYVRVRAINAAGAGPPSNEVIVALPNGFLPGRPTGLTSVVAGSSVTLRWQMPSTGGLPSGYVLLAGSAPGLSNLASMPTGPSTVFSVGGVPPGVYYVRLVAINAAGAGRTVE